MLESESLTLVETLHSDGKNRHVRVSCNKCGTKFETTLGNARKNRVGCKACATRQNKTRKGSARRQAHYSHIHRASELGGTDFSDIQVWEKFVQQPCHYCGETQSNTHKSKSGEEYRCNGIDRVDNSEGYTFWNSVPCCKTCNWMKQGLGKEEFINRCKTIAEKHS